MMPVRSCAQSKEGRAKLLLSRKVNAYTKFDGSAGASPTLAVIRQYVTTWPKIRKWKLSNLARFRYHLHTASNPVELVERFTICTNRSHERGKGT